MDTLEKKWLNALNGVSQVLNTNNQKYFLDTGTLLGAIREKKFIEWDNDIDIGIIDFDFKKKSFYEISNSLFKAGFCVSTGYEGITIYPKDMSVEISVKFYKEKDKYYELELIKIDGNKLLFSISEYLNRNIFFRKGYGINFNIKTYIFYVLTNLSFVCPNFIIAFLREISKPISKLVQIDKKLFKEFKEIEFYDSKFFVPTLFNDYLTSRYGSNWTVPNKNYNYIVDDRSLK
ncbi:MAG: LicD family protein [Ignavibacteriae bacterium]|nr:LicD family protein [Ignavibacteriota bacterium]